MTSSTEAELLIVAEVSPEDYGKLIPFGVGEVEGHSWSEHTRKAAGLRLMLQEGGFDATRLRDFPELCLTVPGSCAGLEEYFRKSVGQLDNQLRSRVGESLEAQHVLVFNLMPFYLSPSRVDKIISGLYAAGSPLKRFRLVVLLLRNIDCLLKSKVFEDFLGNGKLTAETWAFDIRCYGARFPAQKRQENIRISREPFRAILNTNYQDVYHSLIYETNSFIGHFALENSHVRTHYDLTEYIKRDNVWEFLYEKFLQQVGDVKRVLLIGAGMENSVIWSMGDHLKTLLEDLVCVDFYHCSDLSPATVIQADWPGKYDLAILVTDIVNTGMTVKPWVTQLTRRKQGTTPVKIFAVARMRNSPPEIGGAPLTAGIEIKRDYYPNKSKECLLCDIRQPMIRVRTAADFCQVVSDQLTPYDFWEMVSEAQALKRSEPDPQGRSLAYRIDTSKVVRHYGRWLGNVIKHKFSRTWPNLQPDALCTVNEPTGIAFARLVARALQVMPIVSIDRCELRRATPGGGLPAGARDPLAPYRNVLLVDDGMNYGNTMKGLIAFCRAANVDPMGGLVLDSRLDEGKTKHISRMMGNQPLLALYQWPASTQGL